MGSIVINAQGTAASASASSSNNNTATTDASTTAFCLLAHECVVTDNNRSLLACLL
jgi:hypothetical protein